MIITCYGLHRRLIAYSQAWRLCNLLSSYTETVADPESVTVLCYNSKHVFLPVEVGDRIVRFLTNEDIKLYGRADEYAGFDGS